MQQCTRVRIPSFRIVRTRECYGGRFFIPSQVPPQPYTRDTGWPIGCQRQWSSSLRRRRKGGQCIRIAVRVPRVPQGRPAGRTKRRSGSEGGPTTGSVRHAQPLESRRPNSTQAGTRAASRTRRGSTGGMMGSAKSNDAMGRPRTTKTTPSARGSQPLREPDNGRRRPAGPAWPATQHPRRLGKSITKKTRRPGRT